MKHVLSSAAEAFRTNNGNGPFGEAPRARGVTTWSGGGESSIGGSIFLTVFSLPFLAVGTFVVGIALGYFPSKSMTVPPTVVGALGAAFGLAGAFLLLQGLASIRKAQLADKILSRYPAEAWRVHFHGNEREFVDDKGRKTLYKLCAFIFLCIFLMPFNYFVFFDAKVNTPIFVKIGIGIFDVLALFALWAFVRSSIQMLKFGNPRLRLGVFPFFLGGTFTATLEGIPPAVDVEKIHLLFRCIGQHVYTTGTGKNRKQVTDHYELYKYEQNLVGAQTTRGSLALNLTLPDQEDLGTRSGSSLCVFWELKVDAHVPGVDFESTFRVPVYALPTSMPTNVAKLIDPRP